MKHTPHSRWLLAIAVTAASAISAQAAVNLLANGGFEIVGAGPPAAQSWVPADAGYTLSSDARTGNFSAALTSPATFAATMFQNSVGDGGLPGVTPGDMPILTFWAKGFAGTTANLTYQLRYLDAGGGILYNSGPISFLSGINTSTWSQITLASPGTVPVGATSAFLLFSQALGPIDPGSGLFGGTVLIDDIELLGEAIPEPASGALLGLAGLVLVTRRRRA